MRILCFGDSNTFGHVPGGDRYDWNTRWTGQLQRLLGEQYQIIEEGLCGRTTVFDDKFLPGRCGLEEVERLVKLYDPVDIFVVMLGTNDCKIQFKANAEMIAQGLEQILEKAQNSSKGLLQILVVAPACVDEAVVTGDFRIEFDRSSVEISRELAAEFKQIAKKHHCAFLDASKVIKVSKVDGLHLNETGHEALASSIYSKITKMIQPYI